MPRKNLLEEAQNTYGREMKKRRLGCGCGVPRVRRTRCDGFGPQLVVLELVKISLHEATGLDALKRHWSIGGTAVGGGGRETRELRSSRRRDTLISSHHLMAVSHAYLSNC